MNWRVGIWSCLIWLAVTGVSQAGNSAPQYVLVLDVSNSMNWDFAGRTNSGPESTRRIQLLKGLTGYLNDLNGATVTVVLFNNVVEAPQEFQLQANGRGRADLMHLLDKRFGQPLPDGGTNLYGALWSTLSRIDAQLENDPTQMVHVHLVSDGENRESKQTIRDLESVLKRLCERSRGNRGRFSLSYAVMGAKFDRDLKAALDPYKDCLNISVDEFRRPVSWSVTPRQVELASFAEQATQVIDLRFDRNLTGYVAELKAEGLTLSPSTIAISDKPQRIRVSGRAALDGATHILQVIPVHRAGEQVSPVPAAATIELTVNAPRHPSFEIAGVRGDYLELQTGESYTVRLVKPVSVEAFRWECPDWSSPKAGLSQAVSFDTVGKRQITIVALGPATAGRPALTVKRTLTVNVVAWGGAYTSAPSLALVNESTPFELKLIGDVKAKWLVDGALAPQTAVSRDSARLLTSFGTPGKHRVQAVIVGRDNTEKPLPEMVVEVIEKPVPAIISPAANGVVYAGSPTLFRVGNAEEFDGLKWKIGTDEYPLARGSRDLELRLAAEMKGTVQATVSGAMRRKPGVVTSSSVTIEVRDLPQIEIVQPRNFAQVVMPPAGGVSVALELARKSIADVKADSIQWAVVGEGDQKPQEFTGMQAQVSISEAGNYIASVRAQAATGEWVTASSHFTVTRELRLIIIEPAANALLNQGQRSVFAIDQPQAFEQVEWTVNDQMYKGPRVEIPMSEAGQAITVAVKASYQGRPQTAETQVTVVPPGIQVLEPLPEQTYLLNEDDQVRVVPRASVNGPLVVAKWEFADEKGKSVVVPGDSANGFLFTHVGTFTAVARSSRTDNQEPGPESASIRFHVEYPDVAYRIEATPTPPRVQTTVAFKLEGRPAPSEVDWDFGDGNVSPQAATAISHRFGDTGPYTVSVTFKDAKQNLRTIMLGLEVFAEPAKPKPVIRGLGSPQSWIRVPTHWRQHRLVNWIPILGQEPTRSISPVAGIMLADEGSGDARKREWLIEHDGQESVLTSNEESLNWSPDELGSYRIRLRVFPYGGGEPITSEPLDFRVEPAANWPVALTYAGATFVAMLLALFLLIGQDGRVAEIRYSAVGLKLRKSGTLLGIDEATSADNLSRYWSRWKRRGYIPLRDIIQCSYTNHWLDGNDASGDALIITEIIKPYFDPRHADRCQCGHYPRIETTLQETQTYLWTDSCPEAVEEVMNHFKSSGVKRSEIEAVAIKFVLDRRPNRRRAINGPAVGASIIGVAAICIFLFLA